ncbi:MAG: MATE family efflux transporter [Clostridia bacterium]|nr:MATE family efflux transporter [Clostridia bacterium]
MATALRRKKQAEIDVTHGPLLRNMIAFVIPVVLSGILQLLYNAADIITVGQFDGKEAVAAVGSTSALINLFVNAVTGLSTGAGMCIAVQLGAKHEKTVREYVETSLVVALFGGLLVGGLGFAFSKPLLEWMATDPAVIDQATLYIRIYFCGFPASMLYNYSSAIIRTAGDTRNPFIYLTVSGFVNVVLNIIFLSVFHMGVAGVAVATLASQALSAFLCLRHLFRLPENHPCRTSPGSIRFFPQRMVSVLGTGLPISVQGMLFSISNIILQSSVNSFGLDAVAGNSAGSNVESFTYIAMNSFGQAALVFMGQNYGARQIKRMKQTVLTSLGLVTAVGISLAIIEYLLAPYLLAVYLPGEEAAIAFGVNRMIWVLLPYFLCGLMEVAVGLCRGLGASFGPMVISVSVICGVRFLWLFQIFPYLRQLTEGDVMKQMRMLYISYPISWLLTFLLQLSLLSVLFRRTKKTARATGGTEKRLPESASLRE